MTLIPKKPKILIVGAGIGGLTAAIALRQTGFSVEVFERATELKEVGAASRSQQMRFVC